ncbi:hypothetical protein DRP05_02000 [Archaeoglobales archaeon]|nr:MAG: hypothetical protein DRP05_02000 [Archaeoglobales archaeon]
MIREYLEKGENVITDTFVNFHSYDYHYFVTNKRLICLRRPAYVFHELNLSKVRSIVLSEEKKLKTEFFVAGLVTIFAAWIFPFSEMIAAFGASLIVISVFFKRKEKYYQIDGDLNEEEKKLWRIPANAENVDEFLRVMKEIGKDVIV